MKEAIILEVIKYLVPSVLSFVIGFLISQFKKFNGYILIIKWVARRLIIEDCKFYLAQGFMTPKESADLERLWDIYHKKLKMNTEGEQYYKQAIKLPIKIVGGQDIESK